eukprot:m.796549 g.796549  ORF g.796549 m.796549 type:complete len:246 (-) comp59245_c1_seq1:107-844(-)
MRGLGPHLVFTSVAACALLVAAIAVQQWHTYNLVRADSNGNPHEYSVDWGLVHACVNGSCYDYDDRTLQLSLLFDPCHVFADKSDIRYCERRVGTYGCMLSATVISFLVVISSISALSTYRKTTNGWGTYFYFTLFALVTVLESIGALAVYGSAISKWNNQSPPPVHDYAIGTSYILAILATALSTINLFVGLFLSVTDYRNLKKKAPTSSARPLNTSTTLDSHTQLLTVDSLPHTMRRRTDSFI